MTDRLVIDESAETEEPMKSIGIACPEGPAEMVEATKSAESVEPAKRSVSPETVFAPVTSTESILARVSREPPWKRPKLPETMENFIDNIHNSQKILQTIMSDEYASPVRFAKVYVGQVKNLKDLSNIILTLNKKIPLKELSHLKRACRGEVLLFPMKYLKKQNHMSIQKYIEQHAKELLDSFEYFKITDVPAHPPKTRKQYIESGRTWSCNFHPDKYIERLCNGDLFTPEELVDHRMYMGMAFEVAKFYLSQQKPNLEPNYILMADLNATVIVDPTDQTVVAVAFDNRADHPVQHSTMIAIDNVAKTQRGGVWTSSTDIDTENLRGIGSMELLLHLKKKYPSVKFGARKYLTKNELQEENLNASECPYLCTDYYVYMIREPCVMCAMALVHARANRVFYYKSYYLGALGSKAKLHSVPSLNHHYEVFTDFV